MTASEIKLEVKDYSLYYGSFKALDSINTQIPAKQVTAIIGPSGCGKSTFLRTFNRMNDLIPVVRTEGGVMMEGNNIFAMDVVDLRRRVGMVFQRPNPFPKSIYDNVAYGPRMNGLRDKAKLNEKPSC